MVSHPPDGSECQRDGIVNATRTVTLSADLCAQAEEQFRGQFGSLEEMLEFVLREVLRDDARGSDEAERRMIEQRLQDLGYL